MEAAGYPFAVDVAPTERRPDPATVLLAWQHSRDRAAALDGTVTLHRNALGMTVTAEIPARPATGTRSGPAPGFQPARNPA